MTSRRGATPARAPLAPGVDAPRLVTSARPGPRVPSGAAARVLRHDRGRLRVVAGPGSGKTSLIVEAVADRVERCGASPESILVLTFSRRAAGELSARLSRRLDVTVSQPMVRTLHSYAYAVVRADARARGEQAPRLLEAGQADDMVRDVLAGQGERGGGSWPAGFHAALTSPAFAGELREFMLRVAERGLGPRDLRAAARRRARPEWAAIADFIDEYHAVGDLRESSQRIAAALDQAELTVAALDRLSRAPLLAVEQRRIRRVFVDEYQDVDPAQARLVEVLAAGADELVVVGDPDQAIYAFRGAEASSMSEIDVDETIELDTCYRLPTTLLAASRRIAARLPGPGRHRAMAAPAGQRTGSVTVRVCPSAAAEAETVVDYLRRLHAAEGIAYREMAIILRSPARQADAFEQACYRADVPFVSGEGRPLTADPVVEALLAVLRCGAAPASLGAEAALALLASPFGGMDPLAIQRLRRRLRHRARADGTAITSTAMIGEMLTGLRPVPDELPVRLAAPLRDLRGLIEMAGELGRSEPAELVAWRVWQRSGMAERLLADRARGGAHGGRADRALDAVIALFGRFAAISDQIPGIGLESLVDHVGRDRLAVAAAPRARDAVSIVSAHAAKGLEWEAVAVAGVQHGWWPDRRSPRGMLGLDGFLDVVRGIDPDLPRPVGDADERRLFYVAITRARHHLLVTAVDDDETSPSEYVGELSSEGSAPVAGTGHPGARPRPLLAAALVADLRRAAQADAATDAGTEQTAPARAAARHLRALAADGIRQADPANWWGLAPVSTEAGPADAALTVSPSQVEALVQCPLRAVLERNGARTSGGAASTIGVFVHRLAERLAGGAPPALLREDVTHFIGSMEHLAPWEVRRSRRLVDGMLDALLTWATQIAAPRTVLAAEVPMQVDLPPVGEGPPVTLRGRVDWISIAADGTAVISDFKTGASTVTTTEALDHAQLAAYQLAAALGAFDSLAPPAEGAARPLTVGGAELVYLHSGRPVVRAQPALDDEALTRWESVVRGAAAASAGPALVARVGPHCARCPVRSSCPAQQEGRQVTEA